MKRILTFSSIISVLVVSVAFAEYCWVYVLNTPAPSPIAEWYCQSPPPSGAIINPDGTVDNQMMLDHHYNWHCANGGIGTAVGKVPLTSFGTEQYGRKFLAMHKQMIYDFDVFREQDLSLGRILTWDVNNIDDPMDPNYNPMPFGIPGSGVTAGQANAITGMGGCLVGTGRAANTPCPGCDALYNIFRHPSVGGQLDTFATAGALGDELDAGWHGSYHGGISSAVDSNENSCNDINPPRTSPNDAMFWRAHKALDEVHSEWQRLQASDIVIVLDRSGSMNQPASGTPGSSKIDAAKSAIAMFASLVEDGVGHHVGLVSFSSAASISPDLGLTPAGGIEGPLAGAVTPLTAGGATSIGDGLLKAQEELLMNGTNSRKAMLLLTDGKENRSPCLDGMGNGCTGMTNDVAATAFGDTHVCAVGYGESSQLDSVVLRDLTERQGGIFTAFTDLTIDQELQLKKFFLQCYANISDETIASDPMSILPRNAKVSKSVPVNFHMDRKATFVLAWQNPRVRLNMLVTTPSGRVVDLTDPSIEQSSGDTWQFVRIPLPYKGRFKNSSSFKSRQPVGEFPYAVSKFGEASGEWNVQAVRQKKGSKASTTFFIEGLASGPGRLLPINPNFHSYTREPLMPTVRIPESSRPLGEFDQVDARVTVTQPMVGIGNILAGTGIGKGKEQFGDLVDPASARLIDLSKKPGDILKVVTEHVYRDDRQAQQSIQYFKKAKTANSKLAAFSGTWVNLNSDTKENSKLVITQDKLSILVHALGACIPNDCDWGTQKGVIKGSEARVEWDQGFVARTTRLTLHHKSIIPTVTKTYKLYDDGTHGDQFAHDHYWSAKLPSVGKLEGHYDLHYQVSITHKGKTFTREADQTIYVEVSIDPEKTPTQVESLKNLKDRQQTKFTFTPMDEAGNLIGPARSELFELSTTGDARIESGIKENGKGTYDVTVSWTKKRGTPKLVLAQNGKTRQTVILSNGKVERGVNLSHLPHKHRGPIDPDFTTPCKSSEVVVVIDEKKIRCLEHSILGARIDWVELDTNAKALSVTMRPIEKGFIELQIPRDLLDSRVSDVDKAFSVFVNGKKSPYKEMSTRAAKFLKEKKYVSARTLAIALPKGTTQVRITGNSSTVLDDRG